MTKKEVLDFKPAPRLENIASDDALILPHPANLDGWNFREPQDPKFSDRHSIAVEFMIFVISALAGAEVREIMDELNRGNPFHHLEP